MPFYDFWDYILSPGFLFGFGLTAATFLPIAWSLWRTWEDNRHKEQNLIRAERRARRQRWAARRRRVSSQAGE